MHVNGGLERTILSEEDMSWLERRLNQTGGLAKQFILLELELQEELQGKPHKSSGRIAHFRIRTAKALTNHDLVYRIAHFFLTYDVFGTFTHDDQETLCRIYKKGRNGQTPIELTITNSLVFGIPQGLANVTGALIAGRAIYSLTGDGSITGYLKDTGTLFLAVGLFYNPYRIGYALKTRKGKEAIGPLPLLYNAVTYWKMTPYSLILNYMKAYARVSFDSTRMRVNRALQEYRQTIP